MRVVRFNRVFSAHEQSLAQAVFIDLQDWLGVWEQATISLGEWGETHLTRVLQASTWSDEEVATLHWLMRDDDQLCFLSVVMAGEDDLLETVSHWLSLAGFSTILAVPQEFGPVRSAGWYDLVTPNRAGWFAGTNVSPRGATLVGGRAMMPSRVLLSANPEMCGG